MSEQPAQDVYDLFMTLRARVKMVLPEGDDQRVALLCLDTGESWVRYGLKQGPWSKRD
jgi:hypothetical protein